MKRFLQRILILLILSDNSSLQAAGAPPISLRINPQIIYYNSDKPVSIVITIDPHSDNRAGALQIVGGDFYTGSEFPVPGLEAPKIFRFERRVNVVGDYKVIAKLLRVDGTIFTSQQTLVVIAGEAQRDLQSKQ